MNNFVYAVDENYNTQLFYSIFSLLDNFNSDVNVYVIHKNPESFINYKKSLENSYKMLNLNIYKFHFSNFDFPNIKDKHVSEATYYRLFIDQIIPKEIDFYTYLDADIVCINTPMQYLSEVINELTCGEQIIGCRTEKNLINENKESFELLGMQSSKYFNAGVMVVNHQKWQTENVGARLLEKLNEIKDKINYWDQDVLNSFFDGRYKELSLNLNYPINLRWPMDCQDISSKGIFLHYQSNNKPWSIRGCFNLGSSFYQDIALKTGSKHHLVKTVRRFDLLHLIIDTFKLNFRNISEPFKFYKLAIRKIFR